jgi:hypothetical protein
MVYAATKNAHLMAEVANIAGGLVCEKLELQRLTGKNFYGNVSYFSPETPRPPKPLKGLATAQFNLFNYSNLHLKISIHL